MANIIEVAKIVEAGNTVKVDYTGKLDDGTVFDSSEGKQPLQFQTGAKQVIPGFDNGIIGMKLNDQKNIKISAKDAYGEMHPEMVIEVPKQPFVNSQSTEPKEGMILTLKAKDGNMMNAIVKAVKGDKMVLDFNHPLAGKNLNFHVKVVEILK
ncbi:peptidylprolyl isomerase [Candidatus Woesearchaeota archaeon]|nr:peptidylprolyl isomerase [Candidatus Woesearchaeota archaeon]